jgi:hypothetical protein
MNTVPWLFLGGPADGQVLNVQAGRDFPTVRNGDGVSQYKMLMPGVVVASDLVVTLVSSRSRRDAQMDLIIAGAAVHELSRGVREVLEEGAHPATVRLNVTDDTYTVIGYVIGGLST